MMEFIFVHIAKVGGTNVNCQSMIQIAKNKIKNREDLHMNNIQKLEAWVKEEKKGGLVDINLFRGLLEHVDLETAAGDLLAFLTGPSEDITNQAL